MKLNEKFKKSFFLQYLKFELEFFVKIQDIEFLFYFISICSENPTFFQHIKLLIFKTYYQNGPDNYP